MKLALILLFVIQFLWIGGNAQNAAYPPSKPEYKPPRYSPVQLGLDGSSGVSIFELFKEILAKLKFLSMKSHWSFENTCKIRLNWM